MAVCNHCRCHFLACELECAIVIEIGFTRLCNLREIDVPRSCSKISGFFVRSRFRTMPGIDVILAAHANTGSQLEFGPVNLVLMDSDKKPSPNRQPPHPFQIIWWANFALLAFTVAYINITGNNIYEIVGSRGGVHGSLGGVYLWIPAIYVLAIFSIARISYCKIRNIELSKYYYIRYALFYILVLMFSFTVV